jgi:hypothetical protein
VTFRTDSVDIYQYGEGIRQYVSAVWANIESIESYELILCAQSETYPEIFLGTHAKASEDLPKKFHLKEIDVSIPYPNFTIFYDRDGRKSLILGWPFSTGTAGDLFLIEDQGLIGVFERLFSALWEMPVVTNARKGAF